MPDVRIEGSGSVDDLRMAMSEAMVDIGLVDDGLQVFQNNGNMCDV